MRGPHAGGRSSPANGYDSSTSVDSGSVRRQLFAQPGGERSMAIDSSALPLSPYVETIGIEIPEVDSER